MSSAMLRDAPLPLVVDGITPPVVELPNTGLEVSVGVSVLDCCVTPVIGAVLGLIVLVVELLFCPSIMQISATSCIPPSRS